MPMTEGTINTAGTMLEQAISADDNENLADAGPADIGRADVNLKMAEGTISAQ